MSPGGRVRQTKTGGESRESGRNALAVWFFFSSRRRHTRLQGDWSSDVCSSDLPICRSPNLRWPIIGGSLHPRGATPRLSYVARRYQYDDDSELPDDGSCANEHGLRSEERRVGEECRSRGAPDHLKKK